MSIIVPKPNYELPQAKRHLAVCVDVYQETRHSQRGDYIALIFAFELQAKRKDGEPFWIRQGYGSSRSKKGGLYKMLTSWMEHEITPEEWESFDMETLIGRGAEIVVVHNTTPGGTFANCSTVLALPENNPGLKASGLYVRKTKNAEPQDSVPWDEKQ